MNEISREQMADLIDRSLSEHLEMVSTLLSADTSMIAEIAEVLARAIRNSGTVWFCGNGGSAADAEHVMAEFVGRFVIEGGAWSGVSLAASGATLTALANDFGFDQVFSRQLTAHARQGDLLVAISTSGESRNVLEAVRTAQELGISTVGVVGGDGGTVATVVDYLFVAPGSNTQRIQEIHIVFWHIVCELLLALMGSDGS